MQRRGFLGAMFAACAAPAVIRSGILMPVKELVLSVPARQLGIVTAIVQDSYVVTQIGKDAAALHAIDIEKALLFGMNYGNNLRVGSIFVRNDNMDDWQLLGVQNNG